MRETSFCRYREVTGLTLALALVICGCRGEAPGSAPEEVTTSNTAAGSDTIVVASTADMRGVNELTTDATTLHSALFNWALFATLLDEQDDFDKGPPTFKPRLATSYEFSQDRLALTFKLRQDAVWSDGEPVTAEDVRWTWQAQTHPDVAWGLADYKRFVRDVEVVDSHTVRFHFHKVYATQLLDANVGVILPKHAWSRLPFSEWRTRGEWFIDHLVVGGPFTLESWEPGQRIVLRRNERFFVPGRPRAERIIFRITPDRVSQLALLRSGEVHTMEWARPADAAALAEDPEIEILSYIPRGINGLVWNTRHPLFAAKEVRRALTLAIDRQGIIDALYYGYARVSDSPYTSNMWVYNKELEPWPYDPARAAEILASQGWTDSDGDGVVDRDGERFSFEILTISGNELRQDILVMVQDQLARIGVEARQRTVEFNTQLTRSLSHDFEVVFTGLGIGTNLDVSNFFHSSAADGSYNFGSYSNPEADRLLDELKTYVDQIDAKPVYDRLQAVFREDLPLTVLYEPRRLVPVRKSLRNVTPNALSTFFALQEWELREEG